MTKEEILNGMSEAEFYRLYPTRESWEAAQAQMAYGGSPYDPGVPFGAGIMMAYGGMYQAGGPYGTDVYTEKKMSPAQWEQFNVKRGYQEIPSQISKDPSVSGMRYKEYYNPTEYQKTDTGFSKVGAPAGYDYNKDTSYKPIVSYGYKEPVTTKPSIQVPQPQSTRKEIARNPDYITYQSPGATGGYTNAVTQYVDVKTGQAIPDISKAYDPQGKYSFTPSSTTPAPTVSQPAASPQAMATNNIPSKIPGKTKFGGMPYYAQRGGTPYYGGPIYPAAYGGDVVEYCWGGLPGGPNEMPAMEDGGYMTYGGYNSPTNYGSFSVPMNDGGDLDIAQDGKVVDWAKQLQEKLAERTGKTVPSGVSKYYGEFEVPNLSQMDSVITSPVNPNIGMAFKGSKSMLVPLKRSAREEVESINKPFTVATPPKRGERDVYIKYQKFGGAYDTTNAGTYPMLNAGGYGSKMKANRKTGGDLTSQGGNQNFLDGRNSTYLNYIKNNVLKNMHQEESQKVMNAFMQMENQMPQVDMGYGSGYMQMGGYQQSFDAINPQNAALQNMYSQQMQQHQDQRAKDQAAFRQANVDLFNLPEAADGQQTNPNASDLLHQFAEEFGPTSRRTGLPLFPANMSPYYKIGKEDAAELAGIPKGFKMEGLEVTPKYGLLGRTKLGKYMGIGPKSIHYKFTGKRGYMPGEPQPDENFKQQAARQAQAKQIDNIMKASASQYGPAPEGTTAAPVPYMPAMIKPGYDASGKLLNQKFPGLGPSVIPASSQFSTLAYGGMPEYQGSILGSQTGNPIQLGDTTNQYSFIGVPTTPTPQSAGLTNPMAIATADESKNSAYVQGPQVQYDPTKDKSQEDVTVEGDIKRKWQGVGQTIGQYAVPAINKLSGLLEQKDYLKAKKKLEQSMLADNTFMTSPMNAKNRGDYDPNTGMFRPDQKVPVQFPGYAQWGGFNTFADGGSYEEGEELDLSPEEIEELRQQGYEIEYLD